MPSPGSHSPAAASTVTGVLRRPEVFPTIAASVIARLPFGALTLLTVLTVTDAGFSYGEAGLASAAFAVTLAFGTPALSRIVDRTGQTRVLLATALTGSAATVGLALAPLSSPLWVFVVIAAVNGAAQPPLAGTMRALWDLLLDTPEDRHVGYAVEAAAVELVFTGGPLVLVGVVASAFGTDAALAVCAVLTGGGTVAFAFSKPSRRWRPAGLASGDLLGPLRDAGVRTMLVVSIGAGAYFGTIELAVTAYGRERDDLPLVGVLLAVWSLASFAGGMAIARARPATDPPRRIVLLMTAMGASVALVGLATATWPLAALLAFTGLWIAPVFATAGGLLGRIAPPGNLTESFGWHSSAIMLGITVAAPAAGFLIDHTSTRVAFAAAALPCFAAAALVWTYRGTLVPKDEPIPTAKI